MKRASIVVPSYYSNNKLFDLSDSKVNRDNCLYSFHCLKESLAQQGYQLATSDIHSPKESDIVFYNEMPNELESWHDPKKSFVLLFETELIRPVNWKYDWHSKFNKVFTWNDELVDKENYIKMNFSHLFPSKIERQDFSKRKLCTLIAGKKSVKHPLELYSERLKTISWFEKNHPEDFDYYGMGWKEHDFGSPFLNKVSRKLKLSKMIPASTSACYKGIVDSKKMVMRNYRFAICYENAQKIPGYITEKIFDCFFAGCVPVYWGAPNISKHIPESCYIDRRQFKDHQELYSFLKNIDKNTFNKYLDAIEDFLLSEPAHPFSSNKFAETLTQYAISI